MDFILQPYVAFFAITLLHFFSALYFAVVRWCHVCAPYQQNPDYYYPARKWLTVMHLFVVCEIPYLLNPANDACFLTAAVVLAWNYPLSAVIVCYTYFREQVAKSTPLMWMVVPLMLAQVCYSIVTLVAPDFCLRYYSYSLVIMATVSFILFALLAIYCYTLFNKVRQICWDNYSNVERFPVHMAWTALASMGAIIAFTSLPLLTQSRVLLAVVQALLACWHIFFLIYILHSQVKPMEGIELSECVDEGKENLAEPAPLSVEERILQQVKVYMATERPYLQSHFTAVELATALGTNRTYLTNAIKREYKSFYHLVNSYRLDYAQQVRQEEPDVKSEILAIRSGFGSYRSYVRALNALSRKDMC